MTFKYNGILPLVKPKGMTSHDCVVRLRKLLKMKRVGHAGTLDPNVTGVLVLCIGQATKVAQYLTDHPKEYEAEITLGTGTTTEDADGQVVERKDISSPIPFHALRSTVESMVGEMIQVPPMYSAVKVKGKRLYQYALEGKEVERPKRKIHIKSMKIISRHDVDENRPSFRIKVTCSKGTYIRTLAVDIGKKLGYPAHMSFLERTKSGPFTLADASTFADVEHALSRKCFEKRLFPLEKAVVHFDKLVVDEATAEKVKNGTVLPLAKHKSPNNRWAVYSKSGELLAVYMPHPEKRTTMKPEKVIANLS